MLLIIKINKVIRKEEWLDLCIVDSIIEACIKCKSNKLKIVSLKKARLLCIVRFHAHCQGMNVWYEDCKCMFALKQDSRTRTLPVGEGIFLFDLSTIRANDIEKKILKINAAKTEGKELYWLAILCKYLKPKYKYEKVIKFKIFLV